MARILRGDVVWANLNPAVGHEQAGRRPIVVLSVDVFNERSGTVIAMALTSQPQRAGFPLTLELESVKLGKRAGVRSPGPSPGPSNPFAPRLQGGCPTIRPRGRSPGRRSARSWVSRASL